MDAQSQAFVSPSPLETDLDMCHDLGNKSTVKLLYQIRHPPYQGHRGLSTSGSLPRKPGHRRLWAAHRPLLSLLVVLVHMLGAFWDWTWRAGVRGKLGGDYVGVKRRPRLQLHIAYQIWSDFLILLVSNLIPCDNVFPPPPHWSHPHDL